MNFTSGRMREEPEISLTSLIDVVFTLIIFFVVTTTFDERSAVQLDLPKASTEQKISTNDGLTVAVDAQGRFYVGSDEVLKQYADSLRLAILRAAGDNRDQVVTLRADAKATHQSVVTAMTVLGNLGFSKVSIATVEAAAEKP